MDGGAGAANRRVAWAPKSDEIGGAVSRAEMAAGPGGNRDGEGEAAAEKS